MLQSDAKVVLLSTAYWELSQEVQKNILILRRTNTPFDDLRVCRQECNSLLRVMEPAREVRGIVLDLRAARARNDPAFEETTREIREKTYQWFRRVAFVFRSVAGKMQIRRLGGWDMAETLVTVSEAEAVAFASERSLHSVRPAAG